MEEITVSFTLLQMFKSILAVCGAITAVSAAVAVILSIIKSITSPDKERDKRLDELEIKVKKHDELLSNDSQRFKEIEEGNRIMQKSMLALLQHGIDGNEIEAMRKAKQDLESYLIER